MWLDRGKERDDAPNGQTQSHSNIDRPTDRQAWEMGAVVGRQVGWGNNKMQLFLLSFVRNALGAVRLQTRNDTFLIPAITLALALYYM